MHFVINKRVDPATSPPLVRYWFTVVDANGEPLCAGDMLTSRAQVIAAIDLMKKAASFSVVDATGEKN